MPPLLQHLVHIFNHDNCRIHHRSDGNGDPAERHHIRVNALIVHHHKSPEDPQWQRNHRHQRGTQVEQEQRAHQYHHGKLFEQLVRQRFDRLLNQRGAIVDRNNLDALRQRFLQLAQFRFYRAKGFQRVLPVAHHDYAASNLPFTVKLRHAPADLRANANGGDIFQQDRDAIAGGDHHIAKILQRAQIARCPHHILRFAHLQQGAAALFIGGLHRAG